MPRALRLAWVAVACLVVVSARRHGLPVGPVRTMVGKDEDPASRSWPCGPGGALAGRIDEQGFLTEVFRVVEGCDVPSIPRRFLRRRRPGRGLFGSLPSTVNVRQVPGDGSCLFHSITVSLSLMQNGTHHSMAGRALREHSNWLRQIAVDVLEQEPDRLLYLQGHETITAGELLQAVAEQYSIEPSQYCRNMRRSSEWGGGPEIVVLSNLLSRPIHVYELSQCRASSPDTPDAPAATTADESTGGEDEDGDLEWRLRRIACFGSPKFDKCTGGPLHILSADSRFPDLRPGQQLENGNHFLALFPRDDSTDTATSPTATTSRKTRSTATPVSAPTAATPTVPADDSQGAAADRWSWRWLAHFWGFTTS